MEFSSVEYRFFKDVLPEFQDLLSKNATYIVNLKDFPLIVPCLGWCHIITTVLVTPFGGHELSDRWHMNLRGHPARLNRRALESVRKLHPGKYSQDIGSK